MLHRCLNSSHFWFQQLHASSRRYYQYFQSGGISHSRGAWRWWGGRPVAACDWRRPRTTRTTRSQAANRFICIFISLVFNHPRIDWMFCNYQIYDAPVKQEIVVLVLSLNFIQIIKIDINLVFTCHRRKNQRSCTKSRSKVSVKHQIVLLELSQNLYRTGKQI